VAENSTETDWQAIEQSPEFRELIRRKKAFVIPATIFFMTWYFGFIALVGYAPDFMGREFITDGLTVGYVLALSQFLMTWVLGWMYVRRASRVFDPLAERASHAATAAAGAPRESRFRRDVPQVETPTDSETREEVPQR